MIADTTSLAEKRDMLLREGKREKSAEYKKGYIDGVLDMYNEVKKENKQ